MKRASKRLAIKTLKLFCSLATVAALSPAMAFQTYTGEKGHPQIDPEIKSFTYFISPTYWDLLAGREKPITEFLTETVKYSFDVMEKDLSDVGITFSFGGFKDIDSLENKDSGAEFNKTIYIDFSSRQFDFSVGAFAGETFQRRLAAGDRYAVGGIIYMNGKFLNWHHPLVENYTTIIHESLHVLGVGHSTNASSIMSYMENWQPRFSVDDIQAVKDIYRYSSGTSPKVTATLSGAAAGGVEIVWINTVTGRSQISVTDSQGVAQIRGFKPGTYYLAARELTPTGPCFSNPTRGFYTSFYQSSQASTNNPSLATVITLTEGASDEFQLKLLSGTKKFDCHFIGGMWCEVESDCSRNRIKPGVFGRANIQNDLSATHHNTDTNTASGVHSSIVLSGIGSATPFSFGTSILGDGVTKPSLGYNLENHTVADLTVANSAEEGTYASMCTAAGEYELMSSMIEVMSEVGQIENVEVWPQYESQMSDRNAPRNYIELIASGEPKKPKKTLGLACGTIAKSHWGERQERGLVMLVMMLWPFIVVSFAGLFKSRKFAKILAPALIGFFLAGSRAEAFELYSGIWFEQSGEKATDSTSETGYRLALQPMQNVYNGLSLGGKFLYSSLSEKNPGITNTTTFASIGPSIGFVSPALPGFSASMTYLLMPTVTYKSTSETTQHGGSGINLDVAARAVFGSVALGPVLSYTSTTYKKETSDQTEQDISLSRTQVQMFLGFWWFTK